MLPSRPLPPSSFHALGTPDFLLRPSLPFNPSLLSPPVCSTFRLSIHPSPQSSLPHCPPLSVHLTVPPTLPPPPSTPLGFSQVQWLRPYDSQDSGPSLFVFRSRPPPLSYDYSTGRDDVYIRARGYQVGE